MNTPSGSSPVSDPPIPENIDLAASLHELRILRRWRTWQVVPLVFFAIAWDSFLVFWYTHAFTAKNIPWMMVIFPIGHVAVGVGLTYFVVASLLNTTELAISPDQVRIRTAPLPWRRNQTLKTTDIRSVWVQQSGRYNREPRFDIRYSNAANRSLKLLTGLNREQADFIEHHLHKTLGLAR